MLSSTSVTPPRESLWGVARRSFSLVRCDLWLQIGPFAFDPSAGYISRRGPVGSRRPVAGPLITSYRSDQARTDDPAAASPVPTIPLARTSSCYHDLLPLTIRLPRLTPGARREPSRCRRGQLRSVRSSKDCTDANAHPQEESPPSAVRLWTNGGQKTVMPGTAPVQSQIVILS
jgi:hypothetical protein